MMDKVIHGVNKGLSICIEMFCLTVISAVGFFLLDSYLIQRFASADSFIANYKKTCVDDETGEFSLAKLQEINPDVVAWVAIDDNPIDYPILQGDPEFTYLNRDMEGNSCLTGSLYIGASANRYFEDEYTIVYGHHMAGGAMLGSLDYFIEPEYLEGHKHGTLITEKATYDIEVLALYKTDAYYESLYSRSDMDSFLSCVEDKENMVLRTGSLESVEPTDKLLIFSTCSANGTADRTILITRLTIL